LGELPEVERTVLALGRDGRRAAARGREVDRVEPKGPKFALEGILRAWLEANQAERGGRKLDERNSGVIMARRRRPESWVRVAAHTWPLASSQLPRPIPRCRRRPAHRPGRGTTVQE